MSPGPNNAITDVGEVRVGHVTLCSGREIRTGVTVILPHPGNLFREKVVAAVHVINAFGKVAGTTQVEELGVLETPIALTNTLSVGVAWNGLVEHALRVTPSLTSVNPLVGECNDSYLNDIRSRHVKPEHVLEAIDVAASGPVPEGVVGAGTGMTCYGWKGGIGTASRRTPAALGGYTLGALALANFGDPADLRIGGVSVGASLLPPPPAEAASGGSCVVVLATDAPASSRQLGRIARRVQNGLAWTGTFGGHRSGEYVFAFSTARTVPDRQAQPSLPVRELAEDGPAIEALFRATAEATEEAVINALFTARTVEGVDGHIQYELPVDEVLSLLQRTQERQ
jgi:D-aminopeptidase